MYMFFKKTRSIRHYFPDVHTAMEHIEGGRRKYLHSKKFIIASPLSYCPRGMKSECGRYYIDSALAAIMYATGKEPRLSDLNTPSESYGWSFDATRDILNALVALSEGDTHYWNELYGTESKRNKNYIFRQPTFVNPTIVRS